MSPPAVAVPFFWDGRARPERPSLGGRRAIRFLSDDDYPPLHFMGPDGVPTGFLVELARAACEVLDVACTIQARRFDTLLDALAEGRGDAVAAAIPITADLRQRFRVTRPFHKTPARFVVRAAEGGPGPVTAASLAGRRIAVAAGTAHEAFLRTYYPGVKVQTYPTLEQAATAVKDKQADDVFGDGLSLALWLGGSASGGCCAFLDGPFMDPAFFGEGVGFVVRSDDDTLRRALDYAMQVLAERGTYAELYLRFFPVGFY